LTTQLTQLVNPIAWSRAAGSTSPPVKVSGTMTAKMTSIQNLKATMEKASATLRSIHLR
jgi:hypothetical protein